MFRKIDNPTKEELIYLYNVDKITKEDISLLYDVHVSTVFYWFKKHGIRTLQKWERQNVPNTLSKVQEDILVGNLLGDGCIPKIRSKETAPFYVFQSRQHAGYVRWLANVFEDWLSPKGISFGSQRINCWNKEKDFIQHFVSFSTIYHPEFKRFRDLFYSEDRKKIVPKSIGELITPMGLAAWYMDDGSNTQKNRGAQIHSEGFTEEENNFLKRILTEKFNLNVNVWKTKNYFYLGFLSGDRLWDLIGEYVWKVPCMRYKLPNGYHFSSSQTIRPRLL